MALTKPFGRKRGFTYPLSGTLQIGSDLFSERLIGRPDECRSRLMRKSPRMRKERQSRMVLSAETAAVGHGEVVAGYELARPRGDSLRQSTKRGDGKSTGRKKWN